MAEGDKIKETISAAGMRDLPGLHLGGGDRWQMQETISCPWQSEISVQELSSVPILYQ